MIKTKIAEGFKNIQTEICHALSEADGTGTFQQDPWKREGGGGGLTRIFTEGSVIEKGGVNFSEVYGSTPEKILKSFGISGKSDFYATGVSIVLHPYNPHVPIIHMNIRYFEMDQGLWWFGGGIDLTPHYVVKSQAQWFHQQLKALCDRHDESYYPRFKKWADDYFYIRHRNETRGIGGIFFDRLNDKPKEILYKFAENTGKMFAPLYTTLMHENKNQTCNDAHKEWQKIRRGRYVEFNLVWDQGTKFGLETQGRTESILMSLPPLASWAYNYLPPKNSEEANTLSLLKKDIDWINIK